MIHKTKAIVLRTIKYGETSLVVTAFTELFGVQTYMVNGIRTAKKNGAKAAMYQPASILDLEVYHNEQKAMNRIKEAGWSFLYSRILTNVIQNSIALYMMELLYKTLKQPEQNTDLFFFCEDALLELDKAPPSVTANFALYFSLQLTHFFGFRINDLEDRTASGAMYLDLLEGSFTSQQPTHPHFLSPENSAVTADILKTMHPNELHLIKLNHLKRRELLLRYQDYYALHIQDFGQMKTLMILQEILG